MKTNYKFTIQLLTLVTLYPVVYIGLFIIPPDWMLVFSFWAIPAIWLIMLNLFLKKNAKKVKIIFKSLQAMTLLIGIALAALMYQTFNTSGWDNFGWAAMAMLCGYLFAQYIIGTTIAFYHKEKAKHETK